MSKKERYNGIVYSGGFVKMENELSLYNLLNYSTNPDLQVQPATLDIYRRLKTYQNHSVDHPHFGKAWMSIERLSADFGINRKTTSKHLKILRNVGLIRMKQFVYGGRRHYQFIFLELLNEEEFKKKHPLCIQRYQERLEAIGKSTEKDSEYWSIK